MKFLGRGPLGEVFECDCGYSEGPGPPDMSAAPGSTGAIAHVSPPSSTEGTLLGRVVSFPDLSVVAEVGGCRRCGANSGTLNVGSDAWGFCHHHSQKWFVGEVDPTWRFEDEETWAENEMFLASFRTVEPLRRAAGE